MRNNFLTEKLLVTMVSIILMFNIYISIKLNTLVDQCASGQHTDQQECKDAQAAQKMYNRQVH